MPANTRLATYGTLAPGQVNEARLAHLGGAWSKGRVLGRLVNEGWGADHGCPGIVFDGHQDWIEVHVLSSDALPAFWGELDAFEGPSYQRTAVTVDTDAGPVDAMIYALSGA